MTKETKILFSSFGGLLFVAIVFLALFFFRQWSVPASMEVFFPKQNLSLGVELASSPDELERGLMFREFLPEDRGMLFVFPEEAKRHFWMKDTKISLDLFFLSSEGEVVDVKKEFTPCQNDPCPVYVSKAPARYVLEVNAGLADKNGISIGDRVEIKKKR